MNPFQVPSGRAALAAPVLMLLAGVAQAHPGHDAPAVHAHTGSPLLLTFLAILLLGTAAIAAAARLLLRRRRSERSRG